MFLLSKSLFPSLSDLKPGLSEISFVNNNLMHHCLKTFVLKNIENRGLIAPDTLQIGVSILIVCYSSSFIFSVILFVRRTIRTAKPFDILLKVNFGDGCKCFCTEIKIPVDFQVPTNGFEGDKNSIFQRLRDRAMKDPSCGQTALIEKKAILVPKSEIMVHSIVTNVVEFGQFSEALKVSPLTSRLLGRQNGDANEIKISRKRSRSHKRRSHRQ